MDIFEALIERFLTCGGRVFVSPQYDIPWDAASATGGSCPDFVVIDETREPREVVVVEVTTGDTLGDLFRRIEERETRWFERLRRDFGSAVRLLAFVRRDRMAEAEAWQARAGVSRSEVCFHPVEDATFPWIYWKNRVAEGLPR